MKEASEGELKGIMGYTEDSVVSTDFPVSYTHLDVYKRQGGIGPEQKVYAGSGSGKSESPKVAH